MEVSTARRVRALTAEVRLTTRVLGGSQVVDPFNGRRCVPFSTTFMSMATPARSISARK